MSLAPDAELFQSLQLAAQQSQGSNHALLANTLLNQHFQQHVKLTVFPIESHVNIDMAVNKTDFWHERMHEFRLVYLSSLRPFDNSSEVAYKEVISAWMGWDKRLKW